MHMEVILHYEYNTMGNLYTATAQNNSLQPTGREKKVLRNPRPLKPGKDHGIYLGEDQ